MQLIYLFFRAEGTKASIKNRGASRRVIKITEEFDKRGAFEIETLRETAKD